MPDYTDIASRIKTGFERGGVAMALRKATVGTYDSEAGTYSGGSTTDYTVTGIIETQRIPQTGSLGQRFFNGVLVQTDDQFVTLAASGLAVDPAPGDLLIITEVAYSIVTMIPIRPGGVDLMFRVLARK